MSSICSRTARGVAVARDIDQARDEELQPIRAQEQQGAPLRSQVHHGFGHRQKPFGAQREQLGARNGLDDVEQQLARVNGVAVGQRERLADPTRDRRDFQHIGVHRGDREEPDEAVLDNAAVACRGFRGSRWRTGRRHNAGSCQRRPGPSTSNLSSSVSRGRVPVRARSTPRPVAPSPMTRPSCTRHVLVAQQQEIAVRRTSAAAPRCPRGLALRSGPACCRRYRRPGRSGW